MPTRADRCAIAIMAKAPQAGRSKTRLCPPLSFEEAARLSGAFLRDMTATVVAAGRAAPVDGFVAYAPAGTEAALMEHVAPGTLTVLADGGDVDEPGVTGFGRVLLQTVRTLLGLGYGSVCVVNSDSPTLSAGILVEACEALRGPGDLGMFGGSSDGGYYLLGLRSAHVGLFRDITWSTERVATQTREQARRLGLPMVELPEWFDVDDATGLRRLLRELERSDEDCAPATRAALRRMALHSRLDELA